MWHDKNIQVIKDGGIIESNSRDIYPEELELHMHNGNNAKETFLDLDKKNKIN